MINELTVTRERLRNVNAFGNALSNKGSNIILNENKIYGD